MDQAQNIWNDISRIRSGAPLVHNITNYVVMNTTANALLSLGASPIMAHAVEEMEEMASMAQSLIINIGTLSRPWIESMHRAARVARDNGTPIVLDPVGAGASRLRTETSMELLDTIGPGIVRGNASEIMALAGAGGATKGVDSTDSPEAAVDAACALAEKYACVVVVSGAFDIITNGSRSIRVMNGDPLMPRVTGMGCTATAVIGAFVAVNESGMEAAANAMALMGIAGEMAAVHAKGPGTLQLHFLDTLYGVHESDIREKLRMERT